MEKVEDGTIDLETLQARLDEMGIEGDGADDLSQVRPGRSSLALEIICVILSRVLLPVSLLYLCAIQRREPNPPSSPTPFSTSNI